LRVSGTGVTEITCAEELREALAELEAYYAPEHYSGLLS
jgi:hypothetical protein